MYIHSQNWYFVDEGDSILKLQRRVSRPEIQLGMGIHSEFSSQEQIACFLSQEAVYFLVHFKFLRVYKDKKCVALYIASAHPRISCWVMPIHAHTLTCIILWYCCESIVRVREIHIQQMKLHHYFYMTLVKLQHILSFGIWRIPLKSSEAVLGHVWDFPANVLN